MLPVELPTYPDLTVVALRKAVIVRERPVNGLKALCVIEECGRHLSINVGWVRRAECSVQIPYIHTPLGDFAVHVVVAGDRPHVVSVTAQFVAHGVEPFLGRLVLLRLPRKGYVARYQDSCDCS